MRFQFGMPDCQAGRTDTDVLVPRRPALGFTRSDPRPAPLLRTAFLEDKVARANRAPKHAPGDTGERGRPKCFSTLWVWITEAEIWRFAAGRLVVGPVNLLGVRIARLAQICMTAGSAIEFTAQPQCWFSSTYWRRHLSLPTRKFRQNV